VRPTTPSQTPSVSSYPTPSRNSHFKRLKRGSAPVSPATPFLCIDFNGALLATGTPCVGAYRHPERELHWAS
jgi:hypothetical protein